MPNFTKIRQTVAEIWQFNGFQNGGRPPSWIYEIQIFKRSERLWGPFAPVYQISWRLLDWSNHCRFGDTAIFLIFQDGDRRHLQFSEIQKFNGWSAARGQCASTCQFSSKSVEQSQRYGDLTVFLQNGGRLPSWICWAPIGTTHDIHLVVSIVMPDLVKIDAVVSITWNFQYFACLWWKRLLTPQELGFGGISPPKMRNNINETPKRHILARVRRPRRLSHQA